MRILPAQLDTDREAVLGWYLLKVAREHVSKSKLQLTKNKGESQSNLTSTNSN